VRFNCGDTVKWRYPDTDDDQEIGFVVEAFIGYCTIFWFDTGLTCEHDYHDLKRLLKKSS